MTALLAISFRLRRAVVGGATVSPSTSSAGAGAVRFAFTMVPSTALLPSTSCSCVSVRFATHISVVLALLAVSRMSTTCGTSGLTRSSSVVRKAAVSAPSAGKIM